jgi:hypothetical protein
MQRKRQFLDQLESQSGQPIDDGLTQQLSAKRKLVLDLIALASESKSANDDSAEQMRQRSRVLGRLNNAVEELRRLRHRVDSSPSLKRRWACGERPLLQITDKPFVFKEATRTCVGRQRFVGHPEIVGSNGPKPSRLALQIIDNPEQSDRRDSVTLSASPECKM